VYDKAAEARGVGLLVGLGLQEHAKVTTKMTNDNCLIKGSVIAFIKIVSRWISDKLG
jgi:hypothetical protein